MIRSFFLSLIMFSAVGAGPARAQVKHMIVIGVDGLGSFGVRRAETPVMDSMMHNGSWTLDARSLRPTLSSPNWASIIMGVKPSEHKIRSNQWQRVSASGDTAKVIFPTVFKIIREADPSSDIAIFHQWLEFERLIEPGIDVYKFHYPHEDTITRKAAEYLIANKPKLLFVHLDLVDYAGHHYGVRSEEYNNAVEKTDRLLGQFMNAVNAAGISGESVILLTSDHGFIGKHHGGFSKKEKRIPFLVAGSGIKRDHHLSNKVTNADIASTLLWLLDIPPALSWSGKAVETCMATALNGL